MPIHFSLFVRYSWDICLFLVSELHFKNIYFVDSAIYIFDICINNMWKICFFRHGSDWTIIKGWSKFEKTIHEAEWRNFHLNHKDEIKSTVKATNGALNDVEVETDGFIVDLTSPILEHLHDGLINGKDLEFQVIKSWITLHDID